MKRIFLLPFLLYALCAPGLTLRANSSCTPYAPTPDERLDFSSLAINGRVLSVKKLEPGHEGAISRYEAELEVLAVHQHPLRTDRKSPPATIRAIFQVSNGYDGEPIITESQPIPKNGERYALFLVPDDLASRCYTTPVWTNTPYGMNLLPLHDGQPDDAPILFGKDAETIAKAELRKHRPELKSVHIRKGFWSLHWTVTLSNTETPDLPEAQIVIDTAGKISNATWIAAEPIRRVEKIPEKDLGVPLLFHLKSERERTSKLSSDWSSPIPATWGRATSSDATGIRGGFYHSSIASPAYLDHLRADDLFGIRRLAVVPTIHPLRPAPTSMIGWSSMLNFDHVAYQAPLILNGCVAATTPLDIPPPKAYRTDAKEGEAQWLEVKVLATLKGDVPKTIRLPYIPQEKSLIKKGERYTFILERDGDQFIMAYPYDPSYTILPLSDDQPDDALLLLESDVARIAKEEYARHRPETDYWDIFTSRKDEGWSVTFEGYGTSAEFFLTKSGNITNGWVAAAPPRYEARESDQGKPLRLTLYGPAERERRVYFGMLESMKPDALIGQFHSLSGEPPLQRIAKQDLASVQQLALSPSLPADSPH